MKRTLLFVLLCAFPVLSLSCACRPDDNPGEDAGQEAKPDPYKPDLTTLEGQWRDSVHTALSYAYQGEVLKIGQNKMPIWWTIYGKKPADGRSLYISLHGGGATDASENDGQCRPRACTCAPGPSPTPGTCISVRNRTHSMSRSSRWPSCSWM